jgi:hypothetical protein
MNKEKICDDIKINFFRTAVVNVGGFLLSVEPGGHYKNGSTRILLTTRTRKFWAYLISTDIPRESIWSEEKQSKFIESMLMQIPVGRLYLAENGGSNHHYTIIDGFQRLLAIKRFHDNKLCLNLQNRVSLNGKTFEELSNVLKNRFEDINLLFSILDVRESESMRVDLYQRLNNLN